MRDSPQPDAFRELGELAELHGIQTGYVCMTGKPQHASAETLKALLGALGQSVETAREIRDALREKREELAARIIEPVLVAWNHRPLKARLRPPKSSDPKKVACRLVLENGEQKELACPASRYLSMSFPALPYGYHRLQIETGRDRFQSLVISAPEKSFSPSALRKNWGVFLPLYSLHSEKSWGAGNLADCRDFSKWIASHGGNVIGTLPLLAAFLEAPFCEPSPYSPASRLFWNEFYLDIERLPEFAACTEAQRLVASAEFQKRLRQFHQSRLVDYRSGMALRRSVLQVLAKFFFADASSRRERFAQFLRGRPEVERYAEFRAATEKQRRGWQSWPQRMREGELLPGDYADAAKRYHLYVQFVVQEQMGQLLSMGKRNAVHLYLDLPLGVNGASYDTWREQETFALDVSAGAPPDVFFTKGQNWGFAPLHPQKLRAQGYRYVLDYLRFQMRHTDMLRIDHVMNLHRLYWVPKGFSAGEGTYVSYPADELYAIFCLESHRHQTMIVGENLGTVPPEVNAAMKRHDFRTMYVMQYELRPDARRALRPPSRLCVASLNTHDMPPFAAFWHGDDIADRARLRLIRGKKRREQERERARMKEALTKFLERRGLLKKQASDAESVFKACSKWLASSRAETVLINLEDLWLEKRPQNVPGTSAERPNWRGKARYTLEEIRRIPELMELLQQLQRGRLVRERRSPLPRPSPAGGGGTTWRRFVSPQSVSLIKNRKHFSLSQRERIEVGENTLPSQRIHRTQG